MASVEPQNGGNGPTFSRQDLIRVVTTPLGFFVLVVLIVEAVLGGFAALTQGLDRTLALSGALTLMVILVAVVALLAYFRPEALMGARPELIHPDVTAQLKRIESVVVHLDQTARYGSTGVLVAALLGLQNKMKVREHCHAGGLTISPLLLENLPETASAFYDMLCGRKQELKLSEHHIVDNFLLNLIKALPPGSTWMGITRLQSREAWRSKSTTVAYYDFQRIAERQTKKRELNYFRLWCFDNERHFEHMKEIMNRQLKSGFQIRYTTGGGLEDISIIWVPTADTADAVTIKEVDNPIDEVEARSDTFQPLCAIKFLPPRGGRELDEMTICSPSTDEFRRLCMEFQDNWRQAKDLPNDPSELKTKPRSKGA